MGFRFRVLGAGATMLKERRVCGNDGISNSGASQARDNIKFTSYRKIVYSPVLILVCLCIEFPREFYTVLSTYNQQWQLLTAGEPKESQPPTHPPTTLLFIVS